jgi:hypothetical protein
VAIRDDLDDGSPSGPWVPIADAAQREGLSYLALGLGIVRVAVMGPNRQRA